MPAAGRGALARTTIGPAYPAPYSGQYAGPIYSVMSRNDVLVSANQIFGLDGRGWRCDGVPRAPPNHARPACAGRAGP